MYEYCKYNQVYKIIDTSGPWNWNLNSRATTLLVLELLTVPPCPHQQIEVAQLPSWYQSNTLHQQFCWPSMEADTKAFISTCFEQTGNLWSPALTSPPSHPWSHIVLGFITGLPLSEGKTAMLTNHFSAKSPFAKETGPPGGLCLLPPWSATRHVWQRAPVHLWRVWKAFCTALGATVSLSSGYNPQTNGQTQHDTTIRSSASIPLPGVHSCPGWKIKTIGITSVSLPQD